MLCFDSIFVSIFVRAPLPLRARSRGASSCTKDLASAPRYAKPEANISAAGRDRSSLISKFSTSKFSTRMARETHNRAADVAAIDGGALRALLASGTTWLERKTAAVNALNVFPVPDGDTGTNMLLTMQAALASVVKLAATEVGKAMQAAARGGLLGARGNSGVILSQILAGMARALDGVASCDGPALARALAEGAASAYSAVPRPVEGTILTVAKAAGAAAMAVVWRSEEGRRPPTCQQVLECAVAAARDAVARTPDQLPMLRQAGVVDAGGEGYRLILEGMALAHRWPPGSGVNAPEPVHVARAAAGGPAGVVTAAGAAAESNAPAGPVSVDVSAIPEQEWGYCTQFLIRGEQLDVGHIRGELQSFAESTLVVGDSSLVRVHGHTQDPGELISYAVLQGRLQSISIEDMDAQHDAWLRGQIKGAAVAEGVLDGVALPACPVAPPAAALATVVVAPGPGMDAVLRGLGAGHVVLGGQTMNPSAQDLLEAAQQTGAQTVIVLPNNANVMLAAQQAAQLAGAADPRLLVVPTRTVPQGIAAQVAFRAEATAEVNVAMMATAAAAVRTVEVTRATRSITLGDITVHEGDAVGLLDDDLVSAAPGTLEAARQALERAGAGTAEIITVYSGAAVDAAAVNAFVDGLRETYGGTEIELVPGGQPHSDYIISVE